MTISGTANSSASSNDRQIESFAAFIQVESPEGADGRLALTSARSSQAGALAAGLAAVSPDFVSALGDDILDTIALGEGVADEMRKFEEE